MTDNNNALDNELAEFTDRLMAGEDMFVPDNIRELAPIVEQLHDLTAPDPDVEDPIRERIRARLSQEWDQQYAQPTDRFRPLRSNRTRRLVALAAMLIVVLGAVALVLSISENSDESLQGTATGSVSGIAMAVIALAALGLAAWWYFGQRRS